MRGNKMNYLEVEKKIRKTTSKEEVTDIINDLVDTYKMKKDHAKEDIEYLLQDEQSLEDAQNVAVGFAECINFQLELLAHN